MWHEGVTSHRDQLKVYLINVSEVKQKQKNSLSPVSLTYARRMWRRVNWLGITFFITLWWWWCSPSPDADQSARSTPRVKTISELQHYFKELRPLDMRVCKWRARHRQVKAPGSMAGVPRSRHFRTQRYGKRPSLRHATTQDTDSRHWMRQYGLHLPGLKHRPVTGLCKYTKEPSVRIKCEESLDWLTFTTTFSRAALFHGAW
jgi:hypothetical protein